MKNTKGYSVSLVNKTITITRAFEKAANDFDSKEFGEMQMLLEKFPNFKFEYKTIKKNTSKKSYKGLTIPEMRSFVKTISEEEAEVFEKVVLFADKQQAKYAIIKKYFMNHYKKQYDEQFDALEQELAALAETVEETEEIDNEVVETEEI